MTLKTNGQCEVGAGSGRFRSGRRLCVCSVISSVFAPCFIEGFAGTAAYWTLEEGPPAHNVSAEADAVWDVSGNGNHLRPFADWTSPAYLPDTPFNPVPQTGEANHLSVHFTPNRDLFTDGKPINSKTFSAWTIEASFKPHVTDRWQVVVGKDGNPIGSSPPVALKIRGSDGRLEMGVVDGSAVSRTASSRAPLQPGEWYTAAGVATSSSLTLWLMGPGDSVYVRQETVPINGAFNNGYSGINRTWTVGRGMWAGSLTDWFDGAVGQVRISEVARDPGEFLGHWEPATEPDKLAPKAVIVPVREGRGLRRYLGMETGAAKPGERLLLDRSADLATWNPVPVVLEEASGDNRVRLVSNVLIDDHTRHHLRARVVQEIPVMDTVNPFLQGADPDVLLVGGTVWVYPTYRSGDRRFFAFSSNDLVHWSVHGPVLDYETVDWMPSDKHAWAPGVAEKDGRYFLYFSGGPKPSSIGVAAADSPAGPFIDSGQPLLQDQGDPGFEAIDAMVFTDPESGVAYLYAGGSAGATLRVFRLSDDMVALSREQSVPTPQNFTEAPFVHYRDGTYYISYSQGYWRDASYRVHYSTGPSPAGPWTYRGVILESDDRHKGPGHHSILHNPHAGEWYIIYHRWNDRTGSGPYNGERMVAIDRLEYDGEGLIVPVTMTDSGVGPVSLGPEED